MFPNEHLVFEIFVQRHTPEIRVEVSPVMESFLKSMEFNDVMFEKFKTDVTKALSAAITQARVKKQTLSVPNLFVNEKDIN